MDFAHTPPEYAVAALIVLASGTLRGFAGFGSALLAVPLLSLFMAPAEIVPLMYILSLLTGIQLLPSARRDMDMRAVKRLFTGFIIGFPFGLMLLKALPADAMRIFVGVVVILVTLGLWKGYRLTRDPPNGARLATGAASGFLGGSTSMDGPPVILYFLAVPASHKAGRASLIVYFFLSGILSFILALLAGMVSTDTLLTALFTAPAMFLGNYMGNRFFSRVSSDGYRRVALVVLAMAALSAIGRALM